MQTTLIHLGRILGRDGALTIGYSPERQWVQFFAADPKDKRKTGISVILNLAEYEQLKNALVELDKTIAQRRQGATGGSLLRSIPDRGLLEVSTSLGRMTITNAVDEMATHIARSQDEAAALKFLGTSLPNTPDKALREILAVLIAPRQFGRV